MASIHVYNLAGQQVMGLEKTASLGLNTESLNTNDFSNGMYIVEIAINGETSRQKFMITK
jgi:Secretion system C-terminal sorting domain